MIRAVVDGLSEVGATLLFARDTARALWKHGVNRRAMVDQIYAVGVRSLMTTIISGLFVGAIMAIQINLQLRDFGAQGFLGGLSTSTTIRNVGPVLIAFILSGKVGAYTSAELGTMKVTDQMDAIRCLGTDPVVYLILPRLVAVTLSSFLLLIVGLLMTIAGGAIVSSWHLGINVMLYATNIPTFVSAWSLGIGVVKSFVFGSLIGLICCYRGYYATGGALGVGATVRRTAVECLLCIIIADFTLSSFSTFLYELLGVGRL